MKTFQNVLRVILDNAPSQFEGMADLKPMLEEKSGPKAGQENGDGNVSFETAYTIVPTLRGPAIKREKDGRHFVYIGWYGTRDGVRSRFRRLKVHLHQVNVVWDCEVTVAGTGRDGSPACATATIINSRNIEDYLPKVSE